MCDSKSSQLMNTTFLYVKSRGGFSLGTCSEDLAGPLSDQSHSTRGSLMIIFSLCSDSEGCQWPASTLQFQGGLVMPRPVFIEAITCV